MDLLLIAILLFLAGVVLGVAEIFIPSGGVLVLLCLGSFVGSIACAFKVSPAWGIVFVLAAPVVMLVAVVKGFKVFPKTRIGRRMILSHPDEPDGAPATETTPAAAPASTGPAAEDGELVGQEGVARTDLRPSGSAQVGARRYNVVSDGDFVDKGAKVRVIEVRGNRIVVEPVDDA